jgi:hypothetical protein
MKLIKGGAVVKNRRKKDGHKTVLQPPGFPLFFPMKKLLRNIFARTERNGLFLPLLWKRNPSSSMGFHTFKNLFGKQISL